MYLKLSKQYGVSIHCVELPNYMYGFYTNINESNYIVVNKLLNEQFQCFCVVALIYFLINDNQINSLNTSFESDEKQLQAIEFAKDYFINEV